MEKLAHEIQRKVREIQRLWNFADRYRNDPVLKNKAREAQRTWLRLYNNIKKHGNFGAAIQGKNNINSIRTEVRLFKSLTPREMTTLVKFYNANMVPSRRSRPSSQNLNRYVNALARKYNAPRELLTHSNYVMNYKKVNKNRPEVRAIRTFKRFRAKALEDRRLAVAAALRNLPPGVRERIVNRRSLGLPSSPVSVGRLFN